MDTKINKDRILNWKFKTPDPEPASEPSFEYEGYEVWVSNMTEAMRSKYAKASIKGYHYFTFNLTVSVPDN